MTSILSPQSTTTSVMLPRKYLNGMGHTGSDDGSREAAVDEHGVVLDDTVRADPVVDLGDVEFVLQGILSVVG